MKYGLLLLALALVSCKTDKDTPELFFYRSVTVDGAAKFRGVSLQPAIRVSFSAPLNRSSAEKSIRLVNGATEIPLAFTYGALDTTVTVTPKSPLGSITAYKLQVQPGLTSQHNTALNTTLEVALATAVDTTDKFPVVSDSLLLDLVQKRTLAYFWDFGHPVSGMARERNSSGDVVTSGGTGFGIMAIVAGIHRGFISRKDGLDRIAKIAGFLKNNAKSYHGAFPHWLNGATGETVPFSQKDNGADLVETSYLFQGLLTARQYFNSTSDAGEIALRASVNDLWDKVEWSWFTKNGENVLYWHWSPSYNWDMNMPIRGWNECLITYVLAASSRTSAVSKTVYDAGWAQNGKMANGNNYYGIKLPLGPANGGPLFFSQYSFLGLDPRQLSDTYARYDEQNSAHTRINYAYCVANPKNYYGYGPNCWGLTASDNASGYSAHSPDNDLGVITPTAALSAMPYTPIESMRALRFFYYKLGDKIFKNYGFVDAFNLTDIWFADSFLAIDQGPVVVMIENHRSQLLWKLFMSCPEVNQGLKNLGFTSPNVKSQTRF